MANTEAIRPSPAYLGVIHVIDAITEWTAKLFMLISVPLIFANVIEVIWRYAFNDPTVWALDLTAMSFGAMFMLGCSYALLKGAHVRTDMLWDKFSERKKGIIDSCAYIIFFLPTMAVLFFTSIDDFAYAYSIGERSNSGAWQPILWPLRIVIPATCGMLFIQGVSELMKSLWAARTGQVLVKHEKIEV